MKRAVVWVMLVIFFFTSLVIGHELFQLNQNSLGKQILAVVFSIAALICACVLRDWEQEMSWMNDEKE